jgi:hypothetical protein
MQDTPLVDVYINRFGYKNFSSESLEILNYFEEQFRSHYSENILGLVSDAVFMFSTYPDKKEIDDETVKEIYNKALKCDLQELFSRYELFLENSPREWIIEMVMEK